jgi:hypothetical protein
MIVSYQARPVAPQIMSEEQAQHFMDRRDMMADVSEALGLARPKDIVMSDEKMAEERQKLTEELLSQGQIDPAFAYAMQRADFTPRSLSGFLITSHPDTVFTGRKAEHIANGSWFTFRGAGML